MPDLLLPLIVLGLSMSLTPGPNNLMIAASGANFGWRRSMPLYLGILAGFVSLLFAVGFGLGTVFVEFPALHGILRYLGAGYLVWLGIRIATG
jgi:threonine/homoserine/homoserine lactone efflux protein